jgi:transcriptional regulator with XRE-family HTH domain
MSTLRDFLKEVMRQKNLKGIDIEARSEGKITNSYVSDILKGKTTNLSVEKINALAQGLGVDHVEVFKAASGEATQYQFEEPWPSNYLVETMQMIMSSPDLTAIVKSLTQLKPAKIKALRKQLEKE